MERRAAATFHDDVRVQAVEMGDDEVEKREVRSSWLLALQREFLNMADYAVVGCRNDQGESSLSHEVRLFRRKGFPVGRGKISKGRISKAAQQTHSPNFDPEKQDQNKKEWRSKSLKLQGDDALMLLKKKTGRGRGKKRDDKRLFWRKREKV